MTTAFFTLAQAGGGSGSGSAGGWMVILPILVIYLALVIFMIVSLWKVFIKAGQPGWGCIIPFYNVILLLNIAGRPIWWIVLMFIPIISLIPAVMIPLDVAKNFGKGIGFGIGLLFLPFIFYPILAFGQAEYNPVDQ